MRIKHIIGRIRVPKIVSECRQKMDADPCGQAHDTLVSPHIFACLHVRIAGSRWSIGSVERRPLPVSRLKDLGNLSEYVQVTRPFKAILSS